MPLAPGMRPGWLIIRLGLFLYDHLASLKNSAPSRSLKVKHTRPVALQAHYQRGFEYADAWVHDARLVLVNAIDAAERGAQILTRTRCCDFTGARRSLVGQPAELLW